MSVNTYLVTLRDRETGEQQMIEVLSPCPHGMQEFVDGLDDLKLAHPEVVKVEERLTSPTTCSSS